MEAIETELTGVKLIRPRVFGDDRGFFFENWNRAAYSELGVATQFDQDNISFSKYGTIRGLHLQSPNEQGKLVSVLKGSVFDVAVDVRVGSPNFGRWVGVELSEENRSQLWIPAGFAHGFCVTSDEALFAYKCSGYYSKEDELTISWDDPDIGVKWPDVGAPVLSDKDRQGLPLCEVARERLPQFRNDC